MEFSNRLSDTQTRDPKTSLEPHFNPYLSLIANADAVHAEVYETLVYVLQEKRHNNVRLDKRTKGNSNIFE